jgi:hypothetical protein
VHHQPNPRAPRRPAAPQAALDEATAAFAELVTFCRTCAAPFGPFEQELLGRMATLGRCLVALFLACRHERLDVAPWLRDGHHRRGRADAARTLKTAYGPVRYARGYLPARRGGPGLFPLDIALGLTWDALSPWVMQWVARLATAMSFRAARRACRAALGWAPATETIEQVALGLGRDAAAFLRQQPPAADEGEVLVIELDGKCPPTATQAELARRRGPRRRHGRGCPCCQRHRGKASRRARREAHGPKPRRRRGDKSKNGKEVVVVVMYTLRRGDDGKLHGPVNKRLYATFGGCRAAADWARAEATKRGFGPGTTKTVQVVSDGAERLYRPMREAFPGAVFTLDVWHVVERLWALGRHFHPEGSGALKARVAGQQRRLLAGGEAALVRQLERELAAVPRHGPGTKGRRRALAQAIGYLRPRLDRMHYRERRQQDLVIGTGQAEGAVKHLVGGRFDGSGMRWRREKAEPLLHLRCIELNGDWERFVDWLGEQNAARLGRGERRRVLTDQGLPLPNAA